MPEATSVKPTMTRIPIGAPVAGSDSAALAEGDGPGGVVEPGATPPTAVDPRFGVEVGVGTVGATLGRDDVDGSVGDVVGVDVDGSGTGVDVEGGVTVVDVVVVELGGAVSLGDTVIVWVWIEFTVTDRVWVCGSHELDHSESGRSTVTVGPL